MKEAEKILREVVGEDCIWEEMNNLTNTPIDLVVKAMDIYKNQALTLPVVVGSACTCGKVKNCGDRSMYCEKNNVHYR